MRRSIQFLVLLLAVFAGVASAAEPRLEDEWTPLNVERADFKNLLVVAISADKQIRDRFEDKFVSHLRSHEIAATTSHSFVPNLRSIDDRAETVTAILGKGVEGVITVRLIPLEDGAEATWPDEWQASFGRDTTLRLLIEQSLPVSAGKARRFGVEATLWDIAGSSRIWGGRTGPHTRKELKQGADAFVESVIDSLKKDVLF